MVEALSVLLMFVMYMRPGETFTLRKIDLVRSSLLGQSWALNLHPSEEGEASKVGVSDESILLDSPEVPWLGDALSCLSSIPLGPLLPTNYAQVGVAWAAALTSLKLPKNYAVLHQLRHSGASWDRYKDHRTALI